MSKKKTASYVQVPHKVLPGIITEVPCNRKAKRIDLAKRLNKTQPGQNRQKPKKEIK